MSYILNMRCYQTVSQKESLSLLCWISGTRHHLAKLAEDWKFWGGAVDRKSGEERAFQAVTGWLWSTNIKWNASGWTGSVRVRQTLLPLSFFPLCVLFWMYMWICEAGNTCGELVSFCVCTCNFECVCINSTGLYCRHKKKFPLLLYGNEVSTSI